MNARSDRLSALRDATATAIVGVGASPQGSFPDVDQYTLGVQPIRAACGERQVRDARYVQYVRRAHVASSIIYRN